MHLMELANRLHTDKGDTIYDRHAYFRVYEELFSEMRSEEIRLLEIGLLHPADPDWQGDVFGQMRSPKAPSLELWSSYFERGIIFGFDINDFSSVTIPRVSILRGNMGSRDDLSRLIRLTGGNFDIVIDDASHASHHQQIALSLIFPHVSPGGLYIIEDLHWLPPIEVPGVRRTRDILYDVQAGAPFQTEYARPNELRSINEEIENVLFFDSMQPGSPTKSRDALAVLVKRSRRFSAARGALYGKRIAERPQAGDRMNSLHQELDDAQVRIRHAGQTFDREAEHDSEAADRGGKGDGAESAGEQGRAPSVPETLFGSVLDADQSLPAMEIRVAELRRFATRLEHLVTLSVSARDTEIAQVRDELDRNRLALARVRLELSAVKGAGAETERLLHEAMTEIGQSRARVTWADDALRANGDELNEARSRLAELRGAIATHEAEMAEANARIRDREATLVAMEERTVEQDLAIRRALAAHEHSMSQLEAAEAARLSGGERIAALGARLGRTISSGNRARDQLVEARAALSAAMALRDSSLADRAAAVVEMRRLRVLAGSARLEGFRHASTAADIVRQSIAPFGDSVFTSALKLSLNAAKGWTSRRDRAVMREVSKSGLFVPSFYAAIFERRGLRPPAEPLLHFVRAGAAIGLDPGPLFDTPFYLRRNPDVALANVPACLHFLRNGGFEGRKPNALFDSRAYLHDRPDVAASKVNPLVHYLQHGAAEGQRISVFFDAEEYARMHGLPSGSADLLAHALGVGRQARLPPCELFDTAYYLERYPDVLASGMHPVEHYEYVGAGLGYKPHPYFDGSFYLQAYQDVRNAGLNPLAHFIVAGRKELRSPNMLFDPRWYRNMYPDIGDLDPLRHYVEAGARERRLPDRDFDPTYYLDANPDLRVGGVDPLQHFLDYGLFEGRSPCPTFDPAKFFEGREDLWGSIWPAFVDFLRVRPAASSISERASPQLLSDLPWRFEGTPRSQGTHYTIICISHAADRTGAPICLLRLVEQLSQVKSIDCRVIVHKDGELTSEFAKHAPVLRIDDVGASSREAAIGMVARLAKAEIVRGVIVTNTVATGEYSDAFSAAGLPILAWLHELPTSIDTFFGGANTIDRIARAASRILTPCDFVAAALNKRYGLDPEQLVTIRYGIGMPRELDVQSARSRVRDEFGLPREAKIVLACGMLDLRKGADLFVQVAHAIHSARAKLSDTWFLWVGHPYDANFLGWIEHDIALLGMNGRILIAGQRVDSTPYFAASDVFALTSREDPFPLVNLEALSYGLPVVSFEGAGGAPEILGDERGIVVPYADVDAMAGAIGCLLDDLPGTSERCRSTGAAMATEHSWPRFAGLFLGLLKDSYRFREPKRLKVSVIVPNYNYARFLPERLDSIFKQSRRPHEIIFLDDHSTDDSVAVAKRLATASPVQMRFVVSDQNSGSTFKQWAKGIALAEGDLVWFAEADDWCKPDFLRELVPEFYDDDVTIAYSQSAIAGSASQIYAPDYLEYTNAVSLSRWQSSYSVPGPEEISLALSQMNTIPNASAVLLRRSAVLDAERSDLLKYKLCGDWWLYAATARKGKLSFVHKPLNFHRRHDRTVTHSMERETRAIVEALTIKREIFRDIEVPRDLICRSIAASAYEFERLSALHDLDRSSLFVQPDAAPILDDLYRLLQPSPTGQRLKVLTVLSDLEVGGGQIAGIRLANALASTGESFVVNARPNLFDPEVASRIDERVVLLEGTLGPTEWSRDRGDGPDWAQLAEGTQRVRLLRDLIRFHRIDVILSHVWWADRLTYAVVREAGVPWIVCMHGCYEALVDHPDWDPAFTAMARPLFRAATGVIYLTPRNLAVFDRFDIDKPPVTVRLFHGFDPREVPKSPGCSLRRSSSEFIFCLCSRAIPEKGWQEAIEAVVSINALPAADRAGKRARLVLIGGGAYADTLRARFADREDVEFHGQLSQVLEIIAQCDVGLMPSRFVSESLPLSIVEYLACGIPVVSTDNGAIAEIVAVDGREAAIVLPLHGTLSFKSGDLATLMLRYMTDSALYATHKANARYVFDRLFDANHVTGQYLDVIRSVIGMSEV
jgi:glycosyltransferase involved in cell wall biosynthesis